jgi:hypothetical protein
MDQEPKLIKTRLGLLSLAGHLGNVQILTSIQMRFDKAVFAVKALSRTWISRIFISFQLKLPAELFGVNDLKMSYSRKPYTQLYFKFLHHLNSISEWPPR